MELQSYVDSSAIKCSTLFNHVVGSPPPQLHAGTQLPAPLLERYGIQVYEKAECEALKWCSADQRQCNADH